MSAERQAAAEAELAAIQQEAADAEKAASDERRSAAGWPILLEDGSEVMVVRKEATASGVTLIAEDGSEYEPTGNGGKHKLVGRVQTDAENDSVEATGEINPAAPAEGEGE